LPPFPTTKRLWNNPNRFLIPEVSHQFLGEGLDLGNRLTWNRVGVSHYNIHRTIV